MEDGTASARPTQQAVSERDLSMPNVSDTTTASVNTFANDGSFMDLFRKKMEEEKVSSSNNKNSATTNTSDTSKSTFKIRNVTQDQGLPNIPHEDSRETGESQQNEATGIPLPSSHLPSEGQKLDVSLEETTRTTVSERKPTGVVPTSSGSSDSPVPTRTKYSLLSHVGKRRGGKPSLKTGTVKKQRPDESQNSQETWSKYMDEVAKYKAHVCADEDKSRPLVK